MPKTKDLSKDQEENKQDQIKKQKCSEEEHKLPGTRNVLRASSNMLGSTDELKRLIKKKGSRDKKMQQKEEDKVD